MDQSILNHIARLTPEQEHSSAPGNSEANTFDPCSGQINGQAEAQQMKKLVEMMPGDSAGYFVPVGKSPKDTQPIRRR